MSWLKRFFSSFAKNSTIHCIKYLDKDRPSKTERFVDSFRVLKLISLSICFADFSGSLSCSLLSPSSAFWYLKWQLNSLKTRLFSSFRGQKCQSRKFRSLPSHFVRRCSTKISYRTSTKVLSLHLTISMTSLFGFVCQSNPTPLLVKHFYSSLRSFKTKLSRD